MKLKELDFPKLIDSFEIVVAQSAQRNSKTYEKKVETIKLEILKRFHQQQQEIESLKETIEDICCGY